MTLDSLSQAWQAWQDAKNRRAVPVAPPPLDIHPDDREFLEELRSIPVPT